MFVNNTLRGIISIVVHIVLIAAVIPWVLLVLPVAVAVYWLLYAVYHAGILRLQSYQLESMAPLLTHVDASVYGLSSIHAYQRVDYFQQRSVSLCT